jgi:putative ABC transport system permease protein
VIRYFLRALRAQLRGGKSLYVLTIVGVALGVASVLAIQIINRNALAAFRGSVQAVSGEADLTVLGRLPTFPESLFVAVLAHPEVRRAWPLYRVDVAVAGFDDLFLDVVGIDLFQPVGFPLDSAGPDVSAVLRVPGWTAISPSLADQMHWQVGDAVDVTSGSHRHRLQIGALVDFQRVTPLASRKLAVMDIAQAQALFGERGSINQIDVQLSPGANPAAVATSLRKRLGPAVDILTPEQREKRAAGLMAAFRVNLTALSMISLFVGLFLVYTSTQASLIRRRAEFGVLRSLGATRAQVFGVIASEVALLGLLGVAIGLPLGYTVAAANIDVVSATLTNLYLLNEIEQLALPFWMYGVAAVIGVGGALVGALLPTLDMSRRNPSALLSAFTLHERLGSLAVPLAVTGTLVVLGTTSWYWLLGRGWQPAGFALAVGLLIGLPLLAPLTVQRISAPIPVRGFGIGYSIRTLAVRLQSTAVAVAALAVAVSMLTGITIMIGSFRRTVELWIDTTIAADVYITTPTWARSVTTAPLDSGLQRTLAAFDEVRAIDRLRGFLGYVDNHRISIAGVEMGSPVPRERFPLFAGDPADAWQRLQREGAVLISEPLARKRALGVGDSLQLAGPEGPLAFLIAGVYYDYSTEAGAAVMDLNTLNWRFGAGPVNSVALYLRDDVDAEAFVDRLKGRFVDLPLLIRSNRLLRAEVMRIFDETFAITGVLQAMSLLIAVAGIMLTLLVIARERISELALYRALGAARRQIFGIFVGKGLSMGLLAIALGTVGGVALAAILVYVINRSYFGWTIQVHVPWRALLEQGGTILAATVAASLYPALRAARTPATELSRDDV